MLAYITYIRESLVPNSIQMLCLIIKIQAKAVQHACNVAIIISNALPSWSKQYCLMQSFVHSL